MNAVGCRLKSNRKREYSYGEYNVVCLSVCVWLYYVILYTVMFKFVQ